MSSNAQYLKEQFDRLDDAELAERVSSGSLNEEAQKVAEEVLASRNISLSAPPKHLIEALETKTNAAKARPWTRYFARLIDIFVFTIPVAFLVAFVLAKAGVPSAQISRVVTITALYSWVLVETLSLGLLGTTPGKWLLGVQVRLASRKLFTVGQAFERTYRVWWRGLAMGLPLVSIITCAVAYKNLTRTGTTSWDRDGEFVVTYKPIGISQALALFVVVVGIFLTSVLFGGK